MLQFFSEYPIFIKFVLKKLNVQAEKHPVLGFIIQTFRYWIAIKLNHFQ